jgi:dihydrofolate synthase/folylpolyglutamate synthase
MTTQEIHRFLDRLGRFGWRLGLDNIRALCKQLGDPQRLFPVIHIAGTNGKGSTAAFIESSLRAAGYRTGLFTSPHLVDVTERIRVNGRSISWPDLGDRLAALRVRVESLPATYFETLTAVALGYFADCKVDVAVVEVGLGGRLDATNVVEPALTVITSIGLDHCEHLGSRLSQIAFEKAGILKTGVPCVAAAMPSTALTVVQQRASDLGSRLVFAPEVCKLRVSELHPDYTLARLSLNGASKGTIRVGMPGRFQIGNAVTAIAALEVLRQNSWRISHQEILAGVAHASWPGRLQRLREQPTLVLDVAHNPAAIRGLVCSLDEIYGAQRRVIFVTGFLADKRTDAMMRALCRRASGLWCVPLASERSADPAVLQRLAERYDVSACLAPGPVEGVQAAVERAAPADLICVTGSHYAVGPVLQILG